MKKTLLTLLLGFILFSSDAQSLRELYQAGLAAYEKGDYQLFKEKMFTIDTMRPNYPPVVYNLACAYALTNESDDAILTLEKYTWMDATKDYEKENDLAIIKSLDGYKKILELQEQLSKELKPDIAFEFPILKSHSECITYSKNQKAHFMGGVRDGRIWKIKNGDTPEVWSESPENSWSVMGITLSKDEKTLWACTAAMGNFEGLKEEDKGKASVLMFDAKKGKLLETFALPANHVFGDMILDSKGNAYISDGTANKIYWVSQEKGKLGEFLDLSGTVFNLQGLTLNESESAIYVSDYIDGIYKIDLSTKEFKKLATPNDVLLKGIDGLYFLNNTLIGLHNGMTPNRVVKYMLSSNGEEITGKEVLAQAGILGEPTQGTIVDNKLYYILNSPWGSYDRENNFSVDEENIKIGVIE